MAEEIMKPGAGTIASAFRKKYGETATIPRDCPWIDPPEWWDRGLTAWGELLTEQWDIAKAKPLTAAHRRSALLMRAAGRGIAEEMQRIAIEVLTGEAQR
jgi:hypothetical protein